LRVRERSKSIVIFLSSSIPKSQINYQTVSRMVKSNKWWYLISRPPLNLLHNYQIRLGYTRLGNSLLCRKSINKFFPLPHHQPQHIWSTASFQIWFVRSFGFFGFRKKFVSVIVHVTCSKMDSKKRRKNSVESSRIGHY
jgi:hypothetical protein